MQPESTLNQLQASLPEGKMPSNYGVYFKNTLVALCHALEDHILENTYSEEKFKPLVLVTFQRGKWYLQEADRYLELAKHSQKVAIVAMEDSGFSTHETSKLDNVSLVHLNPEDSLVNEWNLIIIAPDYASMVLCHELSETEYLANSQPQNDTERKFYGLWTFDRDLVEKSASILINSIESYNPSLAEELSALQTKIKNTPPSGKTDLTGVVNRVVSYLQSSQEELVTVNRQTKEFLELEGKAIKLNRNLAANKLQAFLRMAQKVDEMDSSNPCASLQVSALAETLGNILDLPTLKLRRLRLAGLLFRVGLSGSPKEIFTRNKENLDPSIVKNWRDYPILGARLLSSMKELEPITNIVLHQLEYWDGSGLPDGLKEKAIPIESRIIGLVSYFQELTQPRGGSEALLQADRPAYDLVEALEECKKYSGTRFEPKLIESLSTVIRLAEMGLMKLPDRPSELPQVWLENT